MMQPHREEGEGRYTENRKRSAGRQGRTRGYICRSELGNSYDAGSMWDGKKREEKREG